MGPSIPLRRATAGAFTPYTEGFNVKLSDMGVGKHFYPHLINRRTTS